MNHDQAGVGSLQSERADARQTRDCVVKIHNLQANLCPVYGAHRRSCRLWPAVARATIDFVHGWLPRVAVRSTEYNSRRSTAQQLSKTRAWRSDEGLWTACSTADRGQQGHLDVLIAMLAAIFCNRQATCCIVWAATQPGLPGACLNRRVQPHSTGREIRSLAQQQLARHATGAGPGH